MARYDSARTAAPADAGAHRRFARLAQYFNLGALPQRLGSAYWNWSQAIPRHGTGISLPYAGPAPSSRTAGTGKLLRILPEAHNHSIGRPGIYTNALAVAQNLGELEAYRTILMDHRGSRPDDDVTPPSPWRGSSHTRESHRRESNPPAERFAGGRPRRVGCASRRDRRRGCTGPVPAGGRIQPARREEKTNHWLARLEAAPDRGVLADDLLHWNRYFRFRVCCAVHRGRSRLPKCCASPKRGRQQGASAAAPGGSSSDPR